ncbi:MAG TPA: MotA/TolQ/ExbB proton channel family protein [Candidatus Omnitrophota bacterium]|nr:MotA/TolQ/ExbB proton channel family protein [Candidatus Omnitrophota bacterium]HRZ15386.1 MotA/TolQ/ExbB proton channel family protein [Candidatus Omnitrophota bacterium]
MTTTVYSAWQLFISGGPMMWPILLCSIFACAIVLEKMVYLRAIRMDIRNFLSELLGKIKHHQIKEALQLCDTARHPVSAILKAGILKYDRSRVQIKEAIEDASLYEIPKLEQHLPALAVIAHICPLLGFLGTLAGLARYFQAFAARAQATQAITVAAVSAGLWEALLTSIAGLLVAIPVFVAYNYLVGQVNGVILDMEKASTELVNFLSE